MPRNVEVKARLRDPARARAVARELAGRAPEVERQVDTYHQVDASGARRVKVRRSDRHGLQLIRYARPEVATVRTSEYQRILLRGPEDPALQGLGPPLLEVSKRREVLWIENVRVHLDEVEGLGRFLELEAVVGEEHDEEACRSRVEELLVVLGIAPEDRIRASYSDLLGAGL